MNPREARGDPAAPLSLALPATSANLGAAFDAAALALDLHLHVDARCAEEGSLAAEGRDAGICGAPEDNLVLEVYRQTLREAGCPAPLLAVRVRNEIPIGKGCGSSAAARLAGLMLAVHFGPLAWTPERILQEAARLEGHADNAAACWWGGLAITKTAADRTPLLARAAQLPAADWPLLLVVPEEQLSTEQSRRALPASYARADAIGNVQSALFMAAAFASGQADLLRYGFDDRMHQPYRERFCPCLTALRPLAGEDGIAGVALSGAGPSVLVVAASAADLPRATTALRQRLEAKGLAAEIIATRIERRGARASWSE